MHSVNPSHLQPKYTSCPSIPSTSAKVFFIALGVISLLAGLAATYYFYPSMGLPALGFGGAGGVISVMTTALVAYQRKEVREVFRTPIYLACSGSISPARLRAQNHRVPPFGMSDYTLFESGTVQSSLSRNDPMTNKAMGVMLGMAIGDSVGAPYAYLPYKQTGYREDETINRFHLEHGQWTDDTSMGLCLADALYCGYNDTQLLWALYDWANHAYNTPCTTEAYNRPVGLERTVGHTLTLFDQSRVSRDDTTPNRPTQAATELNTSSCSSLVRNGPVALAARSEEESRQLAFRQSKTTHRGDEAAVCCELMAVIIYHLVNNSELNKESLFPIMQQFDCIAESVNLIAQSKGKYNWLSQDFTLREGSENAGSYALDALAMALHCVFTTNSFEEAVLKAANRGGLADSLGAITGQIAGALYGKNAIPTQWADAVQQWDRGGEIAARGVLLSIR